MQNAQFSSNSGYPPPPPPLASASPTSLDSGSGSASASARNSDFSQTNLLTHLGSSRPSQSPMAQLPANGNVNGSSSRKSLQETSNRNRDRHSSTDIDAIPGTQTQAPSQMLQPPQVFHTPTPGQGAFSPKGKSNGNPYVIQPPSALNPLYPGPNGYSAPGSSGSSRERLQMDRIDRDPDPMTSGAYAADGGGQGPPQTALGPPRGASGQDKMDHAGLDMPNGMGFGGGKLPPPEVNLGEIEGVRELDNMVGERVGEFASDEAFPHEQMELDVHDQEFYPQKPGYPYGHGRRSQRYAPETWPRAARGKPPRKTAAVTLGCVIAYAMILAFCLMPCSLMGLAFALLAHSHKYGGYGSRNLSHMHRRWALCCSTAGLITVLLLLTGAIFVYNSKVGDDLKAGARMAGKNPGALARAEKLVTAFENSGIKEAIGNFAGQAKEIMEKEKR